MGISHRQKWAAMRFWWNRRLHQSAGLMHHKAGHKATSSWMWEEGISSQVSNISLALSTKLSNPWDDSQLIHLSVSEKKLLITKSVTRQNYYGRFWLFNHSFQFSSLLVGKPWLNSLITLNTFLKFYYDFKKLLLVLKKPKTNTPIWRTYNDPYSQLKDPWEIILDKKKLKKNLYF